MLNRETPQSAKIKKGEFTKNNLLVPYIKINSHIEEILRQFASELKHFFKFFRAWNIFGNIIFIIQFVPIGIEISEHFSTMAHIDTFRFSVKAQYFIIQKSPGIGDA